MYTIPERDKKIQERPRTISHMRYIAPTAHVHENTQAGPSKHWSNPVRASAFMTQSILRTDPCKARLQAHLQ